MVVAAVLALGGVIVWMWSGPAPAPPSGPAPAPASATAAESVDAGGATAARLDDLPEDPEPEDPPDEPPRRCAFEGTVTEHGEPAAGAIVVALDGGEAVKTDQRGHFRLDGVACAMGAVRATRGGSSAVRGGYPARDVQMSIVLGDGSALIVTVDDATGAVVPATRLNLLRGRRNGDEFLGYTSMDFDAQRTEGGTLIPGLPSGPYEISACADGYGCSVLEVAQAQFEVRAPQRTVVRIPLTRERPTTGRVVDATDRPVAGARVSCAWEDDTVAMTGADGTFSLPCLGSEHCVVARHPEHGAAAARVTPGTPVKIVLGRPAVLELEVRTPRGQPIPRAAVTLVDNGECGLQLDRETDASGRARVEDLPKGSYVATAHADGWANSDEVSVTVTEGSVTRASLVLPEGLRISGTVLTSNGAPAAGARVKASLVRDGIVPMNINGVMGEVSTETNADGTFELTGLSRGSYGIDAVRAGGEELTDITIADAGTRGEVLRFSSY
jgi:hypothetical protein